VATAKLAAGLRGWRMWAGSSTGGEEEEEAITTFVLLYGPIVQFSRQAGAPEPTVVAMPSLLPLSVDVAYKWDFPSRGSRRRLGGRLPTCCPRRPTIAALPLTPVGPSRRYPPDASPPDSLSHFCFCPVLKLHEPSELSFCLTDSSGHEMYGVSLQLLCRQEPPPRPPEPTGAAGDAASSAPPPEPRVRHRPVALVLLSSRPLLGGFASTLRSLAPLVPALQKLPTYRDTRLLELRVGRDATSGLGLVLNPTNTVLQVEPGSIAARERRIRPGDVILSLDGRELGGGRLSDAIAAALQQAAAHGQGDEAAGAEDGSGGGVEAADGGGDGGVARGVGPSRHVLGVRRTYDRLVTDNPPSRVLTEAVEGLFGRMRARSADLFWLGSNPFWSSTPLEPLFRAMRWGAAEVVYLLLGVLTDQKASSRRLRGLGCAEGKGGRGEESRGWGWVGRGRVPSFGWYLRAPPQVHPRRRAHPCLCFSCGASLLVSFPFSRSSTSAGRTEPVPPLLYPPLL
jgi:hypothetical protein